jgi:hypothetical protein
MTPTTLDVARRIDGTVSALALHDTSEDEHLLPGTEAVFDRPNPKHWASPRNAMATIVLEERDLPDGIRPADVAAISGSFDGETGLGVRRMKWEVAPFGIGEWGSLARFDPDGDRPVFFVSDVLAGEITSEDNES